MNATLPQPPVGFQDDLLRKLSADHSPEQQLWLSGFLYGLAIARHQPADVRALAGNPAAVSDLAPIQQSGKTTEKVTVLFGSQTGNSKKVANKVAARVREQGWEVSVADLNDYPTKNLKEEKIVLLVVSTQGEGDPPVSAEEFHRWLMGPRAPKLDGVRFAVCGLGDKSYLQFCQTGKEFDARFQALGAIRLAERADCDVDFEETVEVWTEAVLSSMAERRSALSSSANGSAAARVLPEQRSGVQVQHDRKHPFAAPILEKIQLNGRGSQKETWHLELSLEGSDLTYEPGDSLGIFPKNSDSLVEEVLAAAKLNGDKTLIFNEKEAPLREILREVELSVLTRDLLDKFADATKNISLKTLPNDPAALKRFFWGRNVADLLREFPANLTEEILLGFLRKMPPRLYSIASSLAAHPDEAHLTVAAVRYDFDGRPHQGVASTFLADRVLAGESVPVFIEHNEYFKLPADDSADIIMVGPGTGVAPFRAFVEERSEARGGDSRQPGKNWLFFGNPHFETDFLYQTEWLNHLKRGTLDRLDVAFSRDQEQKIYVQHRLLERSRLIFERLENGAFFYVCGDKDRMAHDVQNAVLQIIEKESGRNADFAAEYLKGLKKQRRYLEDVY